VLLVAHHGLLLVIDHGHNIFLQPQSPSRYTLSPIQPAQGHCTSCRTRQAAQSDTYVSLEDVIAGKHLPPLGLPEFESYLMHVERSHENLYFMLWFKTYEKQYQSWSRSPMYPQESPALSESYSRAKQIFLVPSAPLELNLPSATRKVFLAANRSAHPPPSALAEIRNQVDGMLRESLKTFVRSCSGNAGIKRGFFTICVGMFMMCLGLAPILLSALDKRSRWLRFSAFPCFWLGATAVICGLHGVCMIIFLFGDARQLTAYELAFPNPSPYARSYQKLVHPSSNEAPPVQHIEITLPKPTQASDYSQYNPSSHDSRMKPLPKIYVSPSHAADEKYLPSAWQNASRSSSPSSTLMAGPPDHLTLGGSTEGSMFDFDKLIPPSRKESSPGSTPVWAPLTKVLDSTCIRMQWETVMRSAAVGWLFAILLVGISVAFE